MMPDKNTIPAEFHPLIASQAMFAALPPEAIKHLISESQLQQFKPAEHLIDENMQNAFLFLLLQGSANAMINRTTVGKLEAGDFAGEISSAGISPPVASVVATATLTVAAFPMAAIHNLARAHPAFAKSLREAGFHRISG